MPARNLNSETIPSSVASALARLGRNISVARTRRGIHRGELAKRIGVARLTLVRVEQGNPNTAIASYFAALWALGLEREFDDLASPDRDEEGKTLQLARLPRVRSGTGLDDNF